MWSWLQREKSRGRSNIRCRGLYISVNLHFSCKVTIVELTCRLQGRAYRRNHFGKLVHSKKRKVDCCCTGNPGNLTRKGNSHLTPCTSPWDRPLTLRVSPAEFHPNSLRTSSLRFETFHFKPFPRGQLSEYSTARASSIEYGF